MAHLTLNCPTCRKRLTYVPLDGLTLHYYCDEHGLIILKPLLEIAADEAHPAPPPAAPGSFRPHGAL